MGLDEVIEKAFADREMPAEVTNLDCSTPIYVGLEDALWFSGRNWREITWNDWKGRSEALCYFNRDAITYWLPSVLLLSLQRPGERLISASTFIKILGSLDWSPSPDHWTDYFRARFVGLRTEECEAIKEWLLFMSNLETYRNNINIKPGPGDIFERAIETVDLLQQESQKAGGTPLTKP